MADGQARFDSAIAKLRGDSGERDLAGALELFRRSAGAGRVDLAVIYANLLAAGIGGPRRWKFVIARREATRQSSCRRPVEC